MLFEKSKRRILIICVVVFIIIISSCKTVKPYQRNYLNDEAMQAGQGELGKYANNAITNREGASGASKGKKSGGCGCN